jgi:hypothetical protein
MLIGFAIGIVIRVSIEVGVKMRDIDEVREFQFLKYPKNVNMSFRTNVRNPLNVLYRDFSQTTLEMTWGIYFFGTL